MKLTIIVTAEVLRDVEAKSSRTELCTNLLAQKYETCTDLIEVISELAHGSRSLQRVAIDQSTVQILSRLYVRK